jgi:hypothetical protein
MLANPDKALVMAALGRRSRRRPAAGGSPFSGIAAPFPRVETARDKGAKAAVPAPAAHEKPPAAEAS